MAILKFNTKEDFVNRFTLYPSRSFIHSSTGITGAIKLTPFQPSSSNPSTSGRHSLRSDISATGIAYDESTELANYLSTLQALQTGISESLYEASGIDDWSSEAFALMSSPGDTPSLGVDKKKLYITRFTSYLGTGSLAKKAEGSKSTYSISSTGSFRKNVVRRLHQDYKGIFRKCDWAYSNAHTINFFTASSVEPNCAVIYPDPTGSDGSAKYRPDKGFTFEFFVNPRYTTDSEFNDFHAGTILHYSSTYALSLITGSSRGLDGRPDGYRLMLQLSASADTAPSTINVAGTHGGGTDDIYFSSDNSLKKNQWHHCAVRWGGLDVQDSTGSFVIDGVISSEFVIPSQSISAPPDATVFVGTAGREDPNALFIGNYFAGPNIGTNAVAGFFNSNAVTNEGVLSVEGTAGALSADPETYGFTHKLNAELHELRIFKEHRDIEQIKTYASTGFGKEQFAAEYSGSLSFYVPPFFVMEEHSKKHFERPFTLSSTVASQTTPYNVTMSFNNEGFVLNQSNFFRDFATKRYPRFFNLTGSTSLTADNEHANQQLLRDDMMVARNFLILPNDNGSFTPGYTLLNTGTYTNTPSTGSLIRRFVDDQGTTDFSIISLNRMLDGRTTLKGMEASGSLYEPDYPAAILGDEYNEAFYNDQIFSSTESDIDLVIEGERIFGTAFNTSLDVAGSCQSPIAPNNSTINFYTFEATGDESSNQAVFFNIPNVFYGRQIRPGSVTIKDTSLSGSNGKISMTLKDDGYGSLYRANSGNPNKLHSVGTIFYNQGIIAIKSPHLFQFGSGSYNIDLQGTQDVFNRELLVEAPKNMLNTSFNPTYQKLAPTDEANETADEFVYISTVLLHDENLNVVGRATLSQPVVKRSTDAITFNLKKDF